MKKTLLALFASYYALTILAPTTAFASGVFQDIEVGGINSLGDITLEVELCQDKYVPAVIVNGTSYGQVDYAGPQYETYNMPVDGIGTVKIEIQPSSACPQAADLRFKINGKLYTDASAKIASGANTNTFQDVGVTNVSGLKLEVQVCGKYPAPVDVNGVSYGSPNYDADGYETYNLKVGTQLVKFQIQPCPGATASDIRFKINGKLYTDASAKAESAANTGGVLPGSNPTDGGKLPGTTPGGGGVLPGTTPGGGILPGTTPSDGSELPGMDDLPNIDSVAKVLKVIDNITNWMFTIFIAVAVIFVLIAAFTYLTSGGGEETAKAHKMLLYSAVAIAVAILAKGVVNVVKSIVQ